MLNAGNLDRRIKIQRCTTTRNGLGEPIETWSTLARVWASKRDMTDVERLRAAEIGEVLTTRFVIRWSSQVADVDGRDRVLFDGLTYNVTGVRRLGHEEGFRLREAIEISAAARSEQTVSNPAASVGSTEEN